MVKLFCAVVGVAGSAFPVDIDEGQSVGDLKKAIKEGKPIKLKDVDADDLQLFLAKKDEGRGPWLTENDLKEGVSDTSDLKLLEAARARLRRVGLSDRDVGGVDEEEEAEGRGPVNVLVVVQSHVRVDIGETGFRALKYKRYRRWIINVQCFVPVILAIITIIVLAFGENPTDEKGCLIAPGRSLIVCRMIGVDIAVGVILSLSQYWKAKLDDMIDEAKNETPLQAQQRTMTYHAAEVQQQELVEQASTAGLQRHDLTELSSLLPADEAHRQTQPQQGSRSTRRNKKKEVMNNVIESCNF